MNVGFDSGKYVGGIKYGWPNPYDPNKTITVNEL